MVKNSFWVLVFCVIFMAAGAAMIVSNVTNLRDGVILYGADVEVTAQITAKEIDRPARRTGIRGESVSVNGTKVRSLATYFYSYFLTVSYEGPEGIETVRAPVSYETWHNVDRGAQVQVLTSPKVSAFVDVAPGATLLYALKQMAIGLAIILLGLAALMLPKEEDTAQRTY